MNRLYRALLRLYPLRFRERYGRGFLETCELRRREARRSRGPLAMTGFHLRETAGALAGAAREWRRERRSRGAPDGSEPGPGGRGRERAGLPGSVLRELRHAARRLARAPGFAAACLVTLALAIGATTAIWSVLKGVVLDPLPYPESDRIVWLDHRAPGIGADGGGLFMTRGLFHFYRERSRTLEDVAIYRTFETTLTGDGSDAHPAATLQATWTLFPVLGVEAVRGRVFGADDGYDDTGGVVVLTHGFWQRRYGGDPDVVGRTIRLNDTPHRVVGVLPAEVAFPDPETEVVIPREVRPPSEGFGGWVERGVGRMAPGVGPAEVEAELRGLVPVIPEAFADPFARQSVEEARIDPLVTTLKEHVVGDVQSTLWILMGTVGFVLLVACANVANLLLVRAEVRRREVALRRALGAGRGALAGHFLSETLVLAGVGGVLGVALAVVGLDAVLALAPPDLPRLHEVGVDGSVLAFAALVTGGAALVFGLVPLARDRRGLVEVLRAGGRGLAGGSSRLRSALVVLQVALALVLVVGSGLMVRSFRNLRAVDPGFRTAEALTFYVGIPSQRYGTEDEQAAFHEALLDRLEGLAGVERAGAVGCLPLSRCGWGDPLFEEGTVYASGEIPPIVRYTPATPGYFEALGIRLVEGRGFEPGERDGAVALVSRSLAERFWPGGSALGRRINTDGMNVGDAWHTVVGVVDAVRSRGLAEPPDELVYYPLVDRSDDTRPQGLYYVLHTPLPPASLVPAVREELRRLDPAVPLSQVASMETVVSRASASTRFTTLLLVMAGAAALVLGLVGIYGVISYVVSLRRGEIGVRIALGAGAGEVRGMVLRRGAALAGLGIIVGLGGALALSRLVESLLFEVGGTDPATYAGAALLLLVVSLAATWIPARRAVRVDPTEALRAE